MSGARSLRALVLTVTVLAALTACSSSDGSSSPPTSASVAPPVTSAAVPSTVPVSPSTPTSAPPTSPTAKTSAAQSSPANATAAPRSTCTTVSVRVIPGGAEPGVEIAALQFTNDGTKKCRLVGFPTAQLVLKGNAIGRPSEPTSETATSGMTLKPGDTAESLLRDFSGCQAPLSDNVRVTVPGSDQTVTRRGRLRACTLRVGPLRQPD